MDNTFWTRGIFIEKRVNLMWKCQILRLSWSNYNIGGHLNIYMRSDYLKMDNTFWTPSIIKCNVFMHKN